MSTPRRPLAWTQYPNALIADTGGNASAEEAEEGVEDTTEQKIDVVYSFRLNETGFDKKGYLTYLKGKEFLTHYCGLGIDILQAT